MRNVNPFWVCENLRDCEKNNLIKNTFYILKVSDATIYFYKTGTVTVQGGKRLYVEEKLQRLSARKRKIFLVFTGQTAPDEEEYHHGVARTINKLGFETILLESQINEGKTILDKLKDKMMDSDYTIVIGTKDEEVVETGSFRS